MASEPPKRALEAAQRFSQPLPPPERALLAVRLPHGNRGLAGVAPRDALARRYPDDAEMQYVRADARFHAIGVRGERFAASAAAAFDTAAQLDSTSARVWAHPVTLALKRGDSARYDRAVAHITRFTT